MTWDVVVVGAGSSGCALAGRLTEDPRRRVLLLEAGAAVGDAAEFPDDVRDCASLAAADPAGPHTWDVDVGLVPGRRTRVGRGRLLGGSSAVNGANHLRATRADLDSWPGWSYDAVLPYYVRGERDLDVRGPLHGDAGPVPVVRPAGELRAALTERFLDAAARVGVPAEPDKNGDQPPGAGLIPANVHRGVRVNAAMAYVLPHLARENLTVRGDTTVARVLLDGDRAVGVEVVDADGGTERIEAGEVVLSAGSVCTPQLLALSGIGPPDALRAAGLPVHHERPGVGRGYSDHPSVYLAFPDTTGGAPLHPEAPGAQAAVHLDAGDDPAGDLEILLFARPFAPGGPCHLMCALQAPESRGEMVFDDPVPGGTPRLEHRYLVSARDRARMRTVVRRAGELLAAGGLALGPAAGLGDRELDAWIGAHLTTSAHLCASARLGPADDPGAVVDPELRVHGLRGLRVVDTSVLPAVPRRGPAATALVLGERAADLVAGPSRPAS